MTPDISTINLDQVHLDLSPKVNTRAWQTSQSLSTPASRWNAYLNELSLQTLLPWLREESSIHRVKPAASKAQSLAIWELVNGTAIHLGNLRLVVIPTTAIDADEFRIPQEWVDIPEWVADYYVSLSLNPDEGWAKILGFASHQTVKAQAQYDWLDHTYSLEESDLISDLNVLWVSYQLCPDAIARTAVAPLPALSTAQAQQLIHRLGQSQVLNPRLAIGFQQWGSLLAHNGWCRQLAQHRWGMANSFSVRQWLAEGISQLADQVGWQPMTYQTVAVGGRGQGDTETLISFSRPIQIGDNAYTLQIRPLPETDNAWRFELSGQTGLIAPGTTLRLLTEDLQPFENNVAIAETYVESLGIDVALGEAEGLVWEVEPTPEFYEREILRF